MSNDNTYKSYNNVDIYDNDIFIHADEYITTILHDDISNIKDVFPSMILYISDFIYKDNNDIDRLNKLFECYYRLCLKYSINPTLELFGDLVHINSNTFSDWLRGDYRSNDDRYGISVKNWKNKCGSVLTYKLQQGGASPNMIFTAKAIYGMVETAPVHQVNIAQHEQIAISAARQQFADFQIEQKED